jgi:hypothetical protein
LTDSNPINAPINPVLFLFTLETLFVASQITANMGIFGVGWGDLSVLDKFDWSSVALPFLNGFSK